MYRRYIIRRYIRKFPICKIKDLSKGEAYSRNNFVISHTQILHRVATSQLNCDKSQITGFHKARDTRARNPRAGSCIQVNKSE